MMFATINLSPKITTKNLNGKTKKIPKIRRGRIFGKFIQQLNVIQQLVFDSTLPLAAVIRIYAPNRTHRATTTTVVVVYAGTAGIEAKARSVVRVVDR